MSTNHTEHYNLSLWEASDQVTRTEFNENHAKLDAALAGKADSSAVAAIQAALPGKADSAALAALSGQVSNKAEQSALSAALARISALESRMPKIAYGSYIGNGTHGAQTPCVLNFTSTLGRPPKLVIVRAQRGQGLVLVPGITVSTSDLDSNVSTGSENTIIWSGNTVSWYNEREDFYQMNIAGEQYYYFAIG